MTFDEIVFICQILWIKNHLSNQVNPKNYPNFTQPVSNSNASSAKNFFFVRGYVTSQIPRFVTPVTATIAQFFAQNQNDIMDLSMFKRQKKTFYP